MKDKITKILFNPFDVIIAEFVLVILLYLLRLSALYHPAIVYTIYLGSTVMLLIIIKIALTTQLDVLRKVKCLSNNLDVSKKFAVILIFFFVSGSVANIYEFTTVGWPIFLQNKVTRGDTLHYIHYITNFLMYSLVMSYFAIRMTDGVKKSICFFVFLLSFIQMLVWLNRGFITLLLVFIVYYEFLRALSNNSFKKYTIKLISLVTMFTMFFGYIGDTRVAYVMENVYGHTINYHYRMSESLPSSFVWVYIYITSPLENFRHMVMEQDVHSYKLGTLLFYPFVAPIFKSFFAKKVETYPYLDSIAGLNVSSYLESAYNDFWFIGAYIYIIFMSLMFYLAIYFLPRGIFGLLVFVSILNMGLWMIFVNGFAVGPFMIGTLLFMAASLFFDKPRIV